MQDVEAERRTRRVSRGLGALRTNLLRTSGAPKPIASTEKDHLPEIAARPIGNEAIARSAFPLIPPVR